MANSVLTQLLVKNAKPKEKAYKLSDGNGAYLYVSSSGVKSWRIDYRFGGKRKTAVLGRYPETSLLEFRDLVTAFRKKLFDGIDPAAQKLALSDGMTFESVALEWLGRKQKELSPKYGHQIELRLTKDVLPVIGKIPIKKLSRAQVREIIARMEERGIYDTVRKTAQYVEAILQYALNCGYIEFNCAVKIADVLGKRPPVQHRKAELDPQAFGELLRRIDNVSANFPVKCALRLMPLLVVRSRELREAKWSEFDFENAVWNVPADRMKRRKEHIVPLSRQVVHILQQLKEFTSSDYCFPSYIHSVNCVSDVGLLKALRKAGGDDCDLDIHGFRATFSTLCREKQFANGDIIEMCLAHTVGNKVEQAYNHAERLQERRDLMQRWADYCDELKRK